MIDTITLARNVADQAHQRAGQVRKCSGDPYIVHPIRVADIVRKAGGDDAMLIAAYLHDTVEDTDLTLNSIKLVFGPDVAALVYHVTEISNKAEGNRARRKHKDLVHYATGPGRAQTVKLADILDNLSDVTLLDPDFVSVYLAEKRALAEALILGNANLRLRALLTIDNHQKYLRA